MPGINAVFISYYQRIPVFLMRTVQYMICHTFLFAHQPSEPM